MTIFVNWKAKDLQEGMENMMLGAKEDYKSFHTSNGRKEIVPGSYGDTELKNYESKFFFRFLRGDAPSVPWNFGDGMPGIFFHPGFALVDFFPAGIHG